MQPQMINVIPHFDPDSNRYKCCCGGCCHIITCAKIIGILELIGLIIQLIGCIVQFVKDPYSSWSQTNFIITLVFLLVFTIIVALLLYGVIKKKAAFLLPHLIMQVIGLIMLIAGIIWSIVTASMAAVDQSSSYPRNTIIIVSGNQTATIPSYYATNTVVSAVAFMMAYLISICLEVWFFINILRCYRYLKEKAIFERMAMAASQSIQNVSQNVPQAYGQRDMAL